MIKKFITWKSPFIHFYLNIKAVCLFLKTKASLSFATLSERDSRWRWSCGELGLILGGWHLSGVLWYRGLSSLLEDPSAFASLFIFCTPPSFPPSPLSSVLKIHMAPTVYSEYSMPLLQLSSSSLLILPSNVSPHPSPTPPHISEFPLIRILRVNPPNSPFHSGLAFSPSAKRTIGWEGKNKSLLAGYVLFWILELVFCLSRSSSSSSSLCGWEGRLLTLSVSLTSYTAFSLRLACSLCLELLFLITSYHAHMPLWPIMDLFTTDKFRRLGEANALLQTELNLTTDTSNLCSSKYKFPEELSVSLFLSFHLDKTSERDNTVHINDK